MGPGERFTIRLAPFLWLGIGYDKRWKELVILLPFLSISILFKND